MPKAPYDYWGKETPQGWDKIVDPLIEKLNKAKLPIAQIKEKFAGLRVYLDQNTEQSDEWIRQAEEECSYTCMVCGEEGKKRGGGWLVVLCDEHHLERENVRDE